MVSVRASQGKKIPYRPEQTNKCTHAHTNTLIPAPLLPLLVDQAQLQSMNEACKSLLDRVGSLRDER